MPKHLLDSDPATWKTDLIADFKIVTPMFIGDANQESSSIRPTAIKGALRFWWRAMQWGAILKSCDNNEKEALIALAEREAKLFGAADEEYGQGIFSISISEKLSGYTTARDISSRHSNAGYLLGQGLVNNKTNRGAISSGEFILDLTFNGQKLKKMEAWEQAQYEIQQAIICMGLFGSLGSRSRHGWGSIALHKLSVNGEEVPVPSNISEMKSWLNQEITVSNELPPFTTFSQQARIDISSQGKQPLALVERISEQLLRYRRNGEKAEAEQNRAERNFPNDSASISGFLKTGEIETVPLRTAFGLPHNYFFKDFDGPYSTAELTPSGEKRERRASPLITHIHRFPSGLCVAIQLFLPAQFLYEGDEIKLTQKRGNRAGSTVYKPFTPNWSVITNFLDRFKQRETLL